MLTGEFQESKCPRKYSGFEVVCECCQRRFKTSLYSMQSPKTYHFLPMLLLCVGWCIDPCTILNQFLIRVIAIVFYMQVFTFHASIGQQRQCPMGEGTFQDRDHKKDIKNCTLTLQIGQFVFHLLNYFPLLQSLLLYYGK